MTKVLAFNCSPRMDRGNTALLLHPFLDGLRDLGAEVELFYTRKLDIRPCEGRFRCWLRTPGECFQRDDMQMLYPRLREADVWVFATPVYTDGVSGPMKNLMDRTVALMEPFFELRDGHSRHPKREGVKGGQVVLVSNCGLWEMDNFDPLLAHMKAFSANAAREFAGALLRPHGQALRFAVEKGISTEDIFAAAREAGRQLLSDGEMSPTTLEVVSRPVLPLQEYMEAVDTAFERILRARERE
jgi:multimeric flavodoxin WrbA